MAFKYTEYNSIIKSGDSAEADGDPLAFYDGLGGSIFSVESSWNIADTTAGGHLYTNIGTNSWTCPAGVTSVSVVCIGGGGGGEGDLKNPILCSYCFKRVVFHLSVNLRWSYIFVCFFYPTR